MFFLPLPPLLSFSLSLSGATNHLEAREQTSQTSSVFPSTSQQFSSLFLLLFSLALPHYYNSSPLFLGRFSLPHGVTKNKNKKKTTLAPSIPAVNAANQGTPVGAERRTGPAMHEVNNEPRRRRDEFRVEFTLRSQLRLLPRAPSDGIEPAITGCR